ncbi:L-threonylcarbamoyladenylate synthase [Aureitalea marina]|uniref:Threonylcarbamoyl-AMP synthase n=1 Tax=Aureitalea marina TaxID=930804 RepID=A0A2S7KN83_9FLAO|nr:L-threonylcarbamoyladenylate synthase [Aureitalea marina]PQB04071.1 threonylcarbamoyl-AMP synthase [Aureitalea marina]
MLLKIYPENPNPKQVEQVVEVLKKGGLIVFPTDTVYAFGCDLNNNKALHRLADIRGVDLAKANFSFICSDLSNLSDFTRQIDNPTYKILRRTLPGPYTFILPGSSKLPSAFKKKKEVGIRVPDHSVARSIVETLGNPLVSASLYDDDEILEYTTDPELIHEKWIDKVDLVVDSGYGGNVPSTVIDLRGDQPELIREGKGSVEI